MMDAKLSKSKKNEIIRFLSEVKEKLINDAKERNFIYEKSDRLTGHEHVVQERTGRSISSCAVRGAGGDKPGAAYQERGS